MKQENAEGVKPPRPRSFSKFAFDEDSKPSPSFSRQSYGQPSNFTRLSSSSATVDTPVSQTNTSAGTLTIGCHIQHARFGRGTVIALSGTGIDAKATVDFENVGTKQLLLRFAKFVVV